VLRTHVEDELLDLAFAGVDDGELVIRRFSGLLELGLAGQG